MLKIIRTWETINFTDSCFACEIKIELNMNRETKKFTITTPNEGMVNLNNKSENELRVWMRCLNKVHNYINENLFGGA